MRTSKSIADDFLKRKAQANVKALKEGEAEKAEAEKAEAEKADELIKAVIVEKLEEVETEKEAEKSKGFEVHTTKPMKEKPLEVHTVEPVIPIKKKAVEEPVKKVAKEPVKKVAKEPVKKVAKEPVERRKFNWIPFFSPFNRRRFRQ